MTWRSNAGRIRVLEEDVPIIQMSHLAHRNSLTADMAADLVRSIADLESTHPVLILTGEGDSFCSGGDLDEARGVIDVPLAEVRDFLDGMQKVVRAIFNSSAVVIASIEGAAVGAGMDIALACDLRVAGAGARFRQPWATLGVVPETAGPYFLQSLSGAGVAADLTLSGRLVDGTEAHALRFVEFLADSGEALTRARKVAAQIAQNDHAALALNKAILNSTRREGLERVLALVGVQQPHLFKSSQRFHGLLGRSEDQAVRQHHER